ncbi:tetratricopeptide repeat protein [Actinomadura darangshiensis]|uniref:Tetratricopeptide repeat protein n=1 Tax=Actinomadura darangshiensis TaxID=705336 RepID=A0A4R5BHL4_9ACTN|nr:tetratricopeptide repeat protein [Actinomadura darangshiensis]TDD84873.1 tetratricopeptide repeat protein [Actinomadura darangshiensis]
MTTYEDFERATLFFDAKDYAGAARLLAPIAAGDPGNRAAVELLGRAYFHSAQLGRAEETFRRLVELDPGNGWAHEALARTLERQRRTAEAGAFRKLARAMGVAPAERTEVSVTAADLH